MHSHRHIGAYGLVIKDEKIVLIKKARGAYKGKFDLPGGGIEPKENFEECLKREIKEETDLDVISLKLLDALAINIEWATDTDIEDLQHLGILYEVETKGNPSTLGDGLDSLGAFWIPIKELKKEDLSPFAIMGLEKLGYELK